ncbi:hypothetical protein B566_EDAN014984 [Ephemera danica]|nr:hypothetical protein B566_EDAN014984 [Ephemera danica]
MAQRDELQELLDTPLEFRYVRGGLSDKVSLFNKQATKHVEGQKKNPFSGQAQSSGSVLDKSNPNYGRPVEGSKTDVRGKKAMSHVTKEILELCEIIHENGQPIPYDPEHMFISFGELFNIYTNISNKVVGILLRARKHEFVQFEGEVLFQRRDDDVPILLVKKIQEIRLIFQSGEAQNHASSRLFLLDSNSMMPYGSEICLKMQQK